MAKVLITGIGGFAGYHLTDYLSEKHEIFGCDHKPEGSLAHLQNINYRRVDIMAATSVADFIGEAKPDYIFHLAALSSVADSWSHPDATYNVNLFGQLNVLNAAIRLEKKPRLVITCSSQEYGAVSSDKLPIKEEAELRPDNPYAASKVFQDIMGLQYYLGYGLPVMRSRSFNHSGPVQSESFVCSDFAKQIASIEAGKKIPEIVAGNLEAKRDFCDVRDVVRAYWRLAESGRPGEAYNVCSGIPYSAGEILEKLLALSEVDISVRTDPAKNRPSDIPILIGDNYKIRQEVGWEPRIPFDQTLSDLLNWWREKMRVEGSG